MQPLTKILTPLVLAVCADAAAFAAPSPIARVTKMLEGIMVKINMQGKMEETSYNKFTKWGKETLTKAAGDISQANKDIEDLQNEIVQLNGDLGSLGATIQGLKKDIASNMEAQKEAEGARHKEFAEYNADKMEAEQCVGALEASIKVLSSGGHKFLQNGAHALGAYQEAQLMSVAADVRGVLQKTATSQYMSEEDLRAVREFVKYPAGGGLSAMQVGQGQNPFGDFAPQSSQIQGILKGLYDSFVENLKKSSAEEATSLKSFEELMTTKKQESKSLTASLESQSLRFAEKKRSLSHDKEELDDTKADLKALEALFEDTKTTCKERAAEWSQRSKLRALELAGIKKATEILNSKEAAKAFKGAASSFVQFTQTKRRAVRLHSRAGASKALRHRAYAQLRELAGKYENMNMATIAVKVHSGSAFDKVIMMIDHMIQDLRKEEQEDIEHRDRCENSENANSNAKEDLAHSASVMEDEVDRLKDAEKAKKKALDANLQEEEDIKKQKEERLKLRSEEHDEFVKALKADSDAVKIITMAQQALSEFFKKGSFLQTTSENEQAPEVAWGKEKGNYGGQQGMSSAAMGALDLIKEDLQKEIETGRAEEAENQEKYKLDAAAMEKALKMKIDTIQSMEKQIAEMGVTLEDKQAALSQNGEDAKQAKEMAKALGTDCQWVKGQFGKRRSQRKAEIAGLQEAKGHLAKANQGEDDDELDLGGE